MPAMNVTALAQALGLPPDLTERAARALYDEQRHRREAHRALAPHMQEAAALYRRKGERLQQAIAARRG